MGGQVRFGPDVEWLPSPAPGEDLAADNPALWAVDPARAALFEAEVCRYWPGLPAGSLQPGYVGVRPKISGSMPFCMELDPQHQCVVRA
jgi:glycine/D-amino acid oxidase-like deaminating enzyme